MKYFSFVDGYMHVDRAFVVRHNAVGHDTSVAEAFFVIFLEDEIEVVSIVAFNEFLLAEYFEEVKALVSLLHRTLNGTVGEDFVSVNIYFVYLDLVVLVDYDVDKSFVFVREVFVQVYFHVCISETFVGIVFLDDSLGAVHDILGNLVTTHELETLLQVFNLTFLCADIVHLTYTGLCAELDFQPGLVAGHLFELDTRLSKESLLHESLHGVCDVIARNGHTVADVDTGISENEIIVVVRRSFNGYAGNLIYLRHGGVEHLRIIYCIGRGLSRS